jgi:hypothetical protein
MVQMVFGGCSGLELVYVLLGRFRQEHQGGYDFVYGIGV